MTRKILVTYASRAGATAGVAEAIGKTLAENGADVDILPMQAVNDLTPYWAVVAGSAIQKSQWLPEARQFVQTNRASLANMPFAMFSVCMTLAMRNGETYRSKISEWIAPVRALVRPVSEAIFAGSLDLKKIPSLGDRLKFRASVAMGVWSEGDHRDWTAIRAWANGLHTQLLQSKRG
jgi:menaquinone-dependent protoporphyrinogen oxidase